MFDGESSSVVRAVKKDSVVKDLQGSELIIEFTQPKKMGFPELSLSEVEATFRNNEIEVKFEFDEKLLIAIQQWPPEESGKERETSENIDCALVAKKVSVDYTMTLRDVKIKMLQHACGKCLKCLESCSNSASSNPDSMSDSILNLCVNEMVDQVRIKLNSDLPGIVHTYRVQHLTVCNSGFLYMPNL